MFHELCLPGQADTLQRVATWYYWPTMRADISSYVKACPDCQPVKVGKSIAPPTAHRPVMAPRFGDF